MRLQHPTAKHTENIFKCKKNKMCHSNFAPQQQRKRSLEAKADRGRGWGAGKDLGQSQ